MALPSSLRDWVPAETAAPTSLGPATIAGGREAYLAQLNNATGLAASTSDETALARSQYADYKRRYQPIEDLLMSSYNNAGMMRTRLDDTQGLVNRGFENAAGMQQRTLSRYGVQVSPQQQAQQQRSQQLVQAAGMTDAINESRRAMAQRDEELLAGGLTANRGQVVGG
jgi:hypothetical protein